MREESNLQKTNYSEFMQTVLTQTQLFQCHREERRIFLRFARYRLCDLIQ